MKPLPLAPMMCLALSIAATSTCHARAKPKPRASNASASARLPAPPKPRRTVFFGTAPEMNARLIIPAIYLDVMLIQGTSDEALRLGPGHDTDSDLPGESGNCVVAAHRNVWGAEFWHLPRVRPGNIIEVRTPTQRLLYRVKWARSVSGTDLSPTQPPEDQGIARLTLYTCTKPRTAARFIVSADLEQRLPSTLELFRPQTLPFPPYHTSTIR